MRLRIPSFIFGAVCIGCGVAASLNAAETEGWIVAIDPEEDLVTLHDGQIFHLPEDISGASLVTGTRVRITYSTVKGERAVSCLAMLPPAALVPDTGRRPGRSEMLCSELPSPTGLHKNRGRLRLGNQNRYRIERH